MKTPEELKAQALDESGCCGQCDFYCTTVDNPFGCQEAQLKTALVAELVAYTEQLESTIRQVNKALFGKENATLEEILQAVSQVGNRLAQVERERDAAEHDLHLLADGEGACNVCARFDEGYIPTPPHCRYACDDDCFRWRGVCAENTKEELT